MEKENQVTEVKNEEVAKVETQTTQKDEGKAEVEMISKEEAQRMVDKALAKNLPPKAEMQEFRDWKESKKTDAEKQTERERELETARNELSSVKQENLALKKGVNSDDLDYVVFKVSKLDGEFEDNLEEFLKENPKFTSVSEATTKNDGTATQKIANNKEDGVMAILKSKHPNLYE